MLQKILYPYIILLIITRTQSSQQILTLGSATIPAHIYKVQLNYNHMLKGILTCNNSNLDIYLYKLGNDILNDSQALMKYSSNSTCSENFSYVSQQYNSYFVRVYPAVLVQELTYYTLTLTINNSSTSYSGVFHQKYPKNWAIILSNSLKFYNIGLRYRSSSSLSNSSTLIMSTGSYNIFTDKIKKVCLNTTSTIDSFIFIIGGSENSSYSLISVNYILQYSMNYSPCPVDCQQNYYWNAITQQCRISTTKSNDNGLSTMSIIIISIIVPIFIIAVVITIMILIYRRKRNSGGLDKNRSRNSIQNLNDTEVEINHETCCICLGEDCNTILPCNHYFHKICIKQWLRKNKICPLCRNPV